MRRGDWRHEAACREQPPELFFPVGSTGPALTRIEEAKEVCQRCPVTDRCLQWAVDAGLDHGVWGGRTEEERRATRSSATRSRIGATTRSAAVHHP